MVDVAARLVSRHRLAVDLVAALLAGGAGTGAAERVRADECVGGDGRLVGVAAVEAALGARFVVYAVALGHDGTGCQACIGGCAAVDFEVCSAVTLVARHEVVLYGAWSVQLCCIVMC